MNSWSLGPQQPTPASVSATGSQLWATGSQAGLDGLTVVRTRGIFTCWLVSVATAGDGFNEVAIGLCNVSENAFGIGASAIPSPLTDMAWDGWFYHANLGPLLSLPTTVVGEIGLSVIRHVIDSKAMRKVRETDVLIGKVEFGTEQGTAVAEFGASTRIMDKLP